MDDLAHYLRLFNSAMAGLVCGLCFLRMEWRPQDPARAARIVGLALICVATAWGSFAFRDIPFKPWVPFVSLGLIFCVYGMRRPAAGEPRYKADENRKKF